MRCVSAARLRSPTSLRHQRGTSCARVLRLVPATSHSRDCGCAIATAADDGADRLRALACQFAPATLLVPARLGLRLPCHAKHRRLSCAGLPVQARVTPSFQLTALRSALLASGHRTDSREPLRAKDSGRAQAPLRLRSGRRNIGDTRTEILAALARWRVSSDWKCQQTSDPARFGCAHWALAVMNDHLRLRCSLRCAPVASICWGQSPCTRAIMLNSAPLPKPAAQDPRQRVPAGSSRVPAFAQPG